MRLRPQLEVLVVQGGDGGVLGGDRGVEGRADAVDRVGDVQRAIAPADPKRGEAIDLGEGAGDHDVFGGAGQFQAIVEARIVGELGIGAVDHQHHVTGQGGVQLA